MKKLLFLLINTLLFANTHQNLLDYQSKYSLCHGKTDYQIAYCLLNGNLNFSQFRGDRSAYKRVKTRAIKHALKEGNLTGFVLGSMPKTKRYTGLIRYIDTLDTMKDSYIVPKFKGDEAEDIVRIKHIFNLLQGTQLALTPERTVMFDEALLVYQERHGLAVDGEIGPQTKRALKQSISSLIVKVKKNLTWERLTQDKGSRYVRINIPEFKMHYHEEAQEVLNMNIVVGKTKMRTPIFNRKIKFIVLNPTWNVPPSIYKKEYAHKSEGYLRKKGFSYDSEGRLYQRSGNRNALGLVKFVFPNKFNVYMHDTPSKSLFNRSTRAFSHGCMRLQKPFALLEALGYSYQAGKTKWITLDEQIPVYVEYHTAWVDDEGIVQLRHDIYGYEWKMFR